MGQTVFLLFDSSRRLVQTRTTASNTGAVDPYSLFFQPGSDTSGAIALEVDPRVVEGIRPEVWLEVSGHSTLIDARDGGVHELLVDSLEDILRAKLEAEVRAAESLLIDFAQQIAGLRGAHDILGELPEEGLRRIRAAEEGIGRCRTAVAALRAGEKVVPAGKILSDLAGKRLPIR